MAVTITVNLRFLLATSVKLATSSSNRTELACYMLELHRTRPQRLPRISDNAIEPLILDAGLDAPAPGDIQGVL